MGRAAANARWAFLGLGVKVLVQGVAAFLVARLVGKSVYGVMGLGLVFVTLTNLLLDGGMGQALIRSKDMKRSDVATVQVATMAIALATTLLTWIFAIPISKFFGGHGLAPLLVILASGLCLQSVAVPGQAVLQRDFQFRYLAGCDMISSSCGAIASVTFAIMHGGPLTLAVQILVGNFIYAVGVVSRSGAPVRGANLAAFRGMIGFTSQVAASQWLGFLSRNIDNVLIARVLGPGPLGQYSLSYRFMMLPITNLTMVANRVLLPTYARLQDDLRGFRHQFLKSCRLMALTATPLMALLIAFAAPLILGAEGPTWEGAIVPTQVLACVAIIQAQTSLITPAIIAFGRSSWQLKWMILSATLTVTAFAVTVHWGLNAVCIGYLIVNIVTLPVPIMLVGRLGTFRWRDFVRAVSPGLTVGGILLLVGIGVRTVLESMGTPLLIIAFGGGALAVLIAVPIVRVLMPKASAELLSLAKRSPSSDRTPVETPTVAPVAG